MWKKILTTSLVLVVVLSLVACVGEPSAQEIIDGVIESFDNIRTYQFDMDMTQDQAGEAEGEALERTVTMDNSGTLDLENRQMRADLTMNVVEPEEDEMEMGVEMYIIDGMMYAMPEAPGEEPTWMKEEVPAEGWEMLKEISGLENYKELLETAQVEVIGSEKVKGVDCYVLQLTPDMAQLWQTVMGQGGVGGGGLPTILEESLQEVFSDFTVKQWIAKDTYFLMKAEIDMAMELTPELMDYLGEEGEMTIDLTMSFLAYNYNQPVSIVLPPEAEEATEVPTNGEEEARETEYYNVSMAVMAMMVDNEMATLPNPAFAFAGGVATNDMTAFPDSTTTAADKGYTGVGTLKAGYVLYDHDLIGADTTTFNTVNYVALAKTEYYYTCEADGTVRQFDGPDVATATEYTY